MRNIINHRVNLPSRLIQDNWDKYHAAYVSYESGISSDSRYARNLDRIIHTTGAYQIPAKTFYKLIEQSKLAKFFKSDEGRFVETKQKVLLRGNYYYPGMLAPLDVKDHYHNIFSEIAALVDQLIELDKDENTVLFLGAIDSLKNYLLILLNALNFADNSLELIDVLNVSSYENLIYVIQALEYSQFQTIGMNKIEWSPDFLRILDISSYEQVLDRATSHSSFDTTKLIRKIRECNNPFKLMHFAADVADEYFSSDTLMMSFSYGGIELPFAVNAMRMIKGKAPLPFIICSLSNYSVGNTEKVTDLNDSVVSYYSENYFHQFQRVLILDDSATTGKTIQTFIDLYPVKLKEAYLGIVSFKNSNRYHHLIRPFHGGINPIILGSAKISFTNNYTKTYKKFSYTNRGGVFDKEKQKVSILLRKSYKLT